MLKSWKYLDMEKTFAILFYSGAVTKKIKVAQIITEMHRLVMVFAFVA